MAEETIVLNQPTDVSGATRVNVRVLDIIASLAAQEVEGVAHLRGSFSERAQEAFGRRMHGKGVELTKAEEGIVMDVYVFLNYGVNVPHVAQEVQARIKTQIAAMTELVVTQVNVHIEGLVSEKVTPMVDPNNLFGDEAEVEKDAEK